MKLLFITQKMDECDDVLGFVPSWVKHFSQHPAVEKVTVICLQKGEVSLEGVKILSLGKELANGRSRLKYAWNFLKYIWKEREQYDSVFVHMNQVYVLLGAPVWWVMGKKVTLWYAHGYTPFTLRVAEKLVSIIFTSTKSGCRLKSKKIRIVGQGIDTEAFKYFNEPKDRKGWVMVGRLSPVKDQETLIRATAEVIHTGAEGIHVDIIGTAGTPEQQNYVERLQKLITASALGEVIKMAGSVEHKKLLPYFESNSIFINTSQTGSLDKAGLEAMACGLPVLTCNEAYRADTVFGGSNGQKLLNLLMFIPGDYKDLAEKLQNILKLPNEEWSSLQKEMREIVMLNHSVIQFVDRVVRKLVEPNV